MNNIKRYCAWCDKEIEPDEKAVGPVIPKAAQGRATHGVCAECEEKVRKEIKPMSFKKWIAK